MIALGAIGFAAILKMLRARGFTFEGQKPVFSHGAQYRARLGERVIDVIASFHPSRQNTNTGKLTVPMFDSIFSKAREILGVDSGRLRSDEDRLTECRSRMRKARGSR
ncbi:MAG TPA: hypothetical protein VGI15_09350, partial [Candidatus Cybelea sp.]